MNWKPVLKQYLETCPQNATYNSHESCDELINSINDYLKQLTSQKLSKAADIVIFSHEATSHARKEMMGLFVSGCNEEEKKFMMEFVALKEVSSTKLEILMDQILACLNENEIDIINTRFCCLGGINSMSGKQTDTKRCTHSIYINCRCYRLALCFKHLISKFP